MRRSFLFFAAFLFLAGLWAAPAAFAQSALRAGDTVEVRIAGVPTEEISQINAPYTIDDNGMINFPYIGLIKAAGYQSNQVQKNIEDRLRSNKIFTHPTITLMVQTNTRFVNIGGAVRSPGRIPYTADLTVLSAINAAGGFNDFADRKRVRMIRAGKATILDMRDLGKDPSRDVSVLPGDQIEVPMSLW